MKNTASPGAKRTSQWKIGGDLQGEPIFHLPGPATGLWAFIQVVGAVNQRKDLLSCVTRFQAIADVNQNLSCGGNNGWMKKRTKYTPSPKEGFTLIELAIVLVIIALLIGGILVGRDLLEASRDRAFISQLRELDQAMFTYRLKYNALPGDDPNATSYFGVQSDCTDNASSISEEAFSGSGVCNGNGDGFIANYNNNPPESFFVWKALNNYAGLFQPRISLLEVGDSDGTTKVGHGIPEAKGCAGAGLYLEGVASPFSTSWYSKVGEHWIMVGKESEGEAPSSPFTSGVRARNIDTKIDDGVPGRGGVIDFNLGTSGCSTTTDPTTSAYSTSTNEVCTLLIKGRF